MCECKTQHAFAKKIFYVWVLVAWQPWDHFSLLIFFILAVLVGLKKNLMVILICIYLMVRWLACFHVLICSLNILLNGTICPFCIWLFVLMSFMISYLFSPNIKVLFSPSVLLLICNLLFHFPSIFFWRAEFNLIKSNVTFSFMVIFFIY